MKQLYNNILIENLIPLQLTDPPPVYCPFFSQICTTLPFNVYPLSQEKVHFSPYIVGVLSHFTYPFSGFLASLHFLTVRG